MAKQSLLFSCFFFFFLLLLIFATAALEEDGGGSNSDNIKCGPWSMDEDAKLLAFVKKYGANNWHLVVKNSGLNRIRQSCRRRYLNILRPGLKKERITREEADEIMRLQKDYGNKWAKIAKHLPGRTNEDIRDFWFSRKNTCNDHRLNDYTSTNHSAPQTQSNFMGYQHHPASAFAPSMHIQEASSSEPFYSYEAHERDRMLTTMNGLNWYQGSENARHVDSRFSPDYTCANRSAPQIQPTFMGYQHQPTSAFAPSMHIQEASSSQPFCSYEAHERDRMLTTMNNLNRYQSSENARHVDSRFSSEYTSANHSASQIQQNFMEYQHQPTLAFASSTPIQVASSSQPSNSYELHERERLVTTMNNLNWCQNSENARHADFRFSSEPKWIGYK